MVAEDKFSDVQMSVEGPKQIGQPIITVGLPVSR